LNVVKFKPKALAFSLWSEEIEDSTNITCFSDAQDGKALKITGSVSLDTTTTPI
jgi:hypothetical protein